MKMPMIVTPRQAIVPAVLFGFHGINLFKNLVCLFFPQGSFLNPTNAKEKLFHLCLNLTLAIENCVYLKQLADTPAKKTFRVILILREEGQPSVIFPDITFYTSKVIFRAFWHSLDQVIQFPIWGNVPSWILPTEQFSWEPIQFAKVLLINI